MCWLVDICQPSWMSRLWPDNWRRRRYGVILRIKKIKNVLDATNHKILKVFSFWRLQAYKQRVLDQVAVMKSSTSSQPYAPNVLKRLQAQWTSALLDASATVQVKTAQLGEVKQYRKQLETIKAFLRHVDTEKNTL